VLTRIEVIADPVRERCVLVTGLLSPRRLPAADGVVRIALVAAGALLLAGDQVRIEVLVHGAIKVEIVETAGTVAYPTRGGSSSWEVDITLTDGATLSWYGEPFVVAEDAEVTRTTRLAMDPSCTAALRESLVFGRHGEVGGSLHAVLRARIGDELVLAEDLDLGPDERAGWAILGTARCLDTVTTFGFRLPESSQTLQLERPGSIARRLVAAQHESDLAQTWAALPWPDKISRCS
jgi:urease accessory protein